MPLEFVRDGTCLFIKNGRYFGHDIVQRLLSKHPFGIHSLSVNDKGAHIRVIRFADERVEGTGLIKPVSATALRGKVETAVGNEWVISENPKDMIFHLRLGRHAKASFTSMGVETIIRHTTARPKRNQVWRP